MGWKWGRGGKRVRRRITEHALWKRKRICRQDESDGRYRDLWRWKSGGPERNLPFDWIVWMSIRSRSRWKKCVLKHRRMEVSVERETAKNHLYIDTVSLTAEEAANLYGFDTKQREQLGELLSDRNKEMRDTLLLQQWENSSQTKRNEPDSIPDSFKSNSIFNFV